jgi:putative ABC transport system permease protein
MTRAEMSENLDVALSTLREHKGRSSLTILGIVIGVTSVISVASIISGLNGFVQKKIESLGARTYFIARINLASSFGRIPAAIRRRKYLEYSDAAYLRATCPDIAIATAFGTRAFFMGDNNQITYGSEHVERVFLRGVEPEFGEAIPAVSVSQGRFITRYDVDHVRSVAVLGTAIADSLFPRTDAIGKTVRMNGKLYEVIGIMEKDSGAMGGPSIDDFVLVPVTDFRKRYPEIKEIAIAFTVARDGNLQRAQDEVIEAMRRRRHVAPTADNDFELFSPDFISTLWNQLTGALVVLTGIISSIGLLVGGIGVMNIMLISVTERTGEIGIRKAIGARRSDIRLQFLLEAVLLSCTGGLIGILLGAGLAFVVRSLAPSVPATVSPLWVALGVGMSVGVGVFFGYYPANRAANLDPIACLRYE